MAELKASLEAMRLVEHAIEVRAMTLNRVVIESDSKTVVSWVTSTQPKPWRHNNILSEIKAIEERLKTVCSFELNNVPRSANDMADYHAKRGVNRPTHWFHGCDAICK